MTNSNKKLSESGTIVIHCNVEVDGKFVETRTTVSDVDDMKGILAVLKVTDTATNYMLRAKTEVIRDDSGVLPVGVFSYETSKLN